MNYIDKIKKQFSELASVKGNIKSSNLDIIKSSKIKMELKAKSNNK